MHSDATTVEEYLAELPEDRRQAVAAVRETINRHLPDGYVEQMGYGMISWGIPLEVYPNTYNKKPLTIASLASQRNHLSMYLMGCYTDGPEEKRLRERYDEAGMRLDMGKCCVRFKRLADVHLDAVAEAIAAVPPAELIRRYEASRSQR